MGFSYDKYLERFNIYSLCYYPKIIKIDKGGSAIYGFILEIKEKARQTINSSLAEPEASLARAMILGDKRGIPQDIRENFSRSGLSHLVAISGLHIGLITGMLGYAMLALGLSRRLTFWLTAIVLAVYIVIIGLPMSAVRAYVMGLIVLLGLLLGRSARISNSLFFVAASMLLFNPRILISDIGFQLSFLAVWGIVTIYPIARHVLERYNIYFRKKVIRAGIDIIMVTVAAQLTTWPILLKNFGSVSLIAPLPNLLVLPLLPVLMGLMFIALPLASLINIFSILIFYPISILFKYLLWVSKFFSNLPLATLNIDYVWPGWLVIYLILLVFITTKLKKNSHARVLIGV
jgi:competence protein ComEC